MEAALASMSWADMKGILSDLEVLLEAHEEASVLRSIKQLRADLGGVLSGREADARRIISDLSARVSAAEAAASASLPSLEEMRMRMAALERRKQAMGEEIARLRGAKEVSAGTLAALTQQMAALKQAAAALSADHTAQLPRVKCVHACEIACARVFVRACARARVFVYVGACVSLSFLCVGV